MTETSITVDHYLQTVEELKKAKALLLELAMTKKSWIGLSNGEMIELSDMQLGSWDLILEVEAKLKEKNE